MRKAIKIIGSIIVIIFFIWIGWNVGYAAMERWEANTRAKVKGWVISAVEDDTAYIQTNCPVIKVNNKTCICQ